MFQSIESQLSFVALSVCCGLAVWKGGPAERSGAVMILVAWLGSTLIQALAKAYILPIVFLASDAVLAAGLLFLAIRFSSLWLGAAMLLQAFGLCLFVVFFVVVKADLDRHTLRLYIAGKNLSSFAMLLVILVAGLVAWRKRSLRSAPARPVEAPPLSGHAAAG